MASLRKPQARPEVPSNAPPTAALPQESAAQLPPVADSPAPLEPIEKPDPVRAAESSAIRDRLREMENAQELVRQAAQQQPQYAAEPRQQAPQMPVHVAEWFNGHPEYLNDAVAQAELNLATQKCIRDGKTWHDPDFIDTIERHLGLRQALPQSNGGAVSPQMRGPAAQAPVRQYAGPPMSAPPSRSAPSMSTGRPMDGPVRLSAEEASLAKSLG